MISEEDQGAKGSHRINKHESGSWDEELGAGPGSGGAEARAQEPEARVWNDARAEA